MIAVPHKSGLDKWLESKSISSTNKYNITMCGLNLHKGKYDHVTYSKYYNEENDYDVENTNRNDMNLYEIIQTDIYQTEIERIIKTESEEYDTENGKVVILIPSGINRFHCNCLFKRFIDEVTEKNMIITIPIFAKTGIIYEQYLLLSSEDKESFYQFCYEATKYIKNNDIENDTESYDNINVISGITLTQANTELFNIEEQMNLAQDYGKILLDILKDYGRSQYCEILDRIFEENDMIFYKWLFDNTIYSELLHIKLQLISTIAKLEEKKLLALATIV